MKLKRIGVVMFVFLLPLLSGCVTRLGTFTVLSTRNIEWSRAGEYQRNSQRITGDNTAHIIIIIPTKFNVTIEDAVDKALEQVPGAVALVDVVLRYTSFYIPYIYGKVAYTVEGSVLVDPKLVSADTDTNSPYMAFYTNDGENFTGVALSIDEYNKYTQKLN
jgi:hypothetical protein